MYCIYCSVFIFKYIKYVKHGMMYDVRYITVYTTRASRIAHTFVYFNFVMSCFVRGYPNILNLLNAG